MPNPTNGPTRYHNSRANKVEHPVPNTHHLTGTPNLDDIPKAPHENTSTQEAPDKTLEAPINIPPADQVAPTCPENAKALINNSTPVTGEVAGNSGTVPTHSNTSSPTNPTPSQPKKHNIFHRRALVNKPTRSQLATFAEHSPELCKPVTCTNAQSIYELNLLNFNELADNFACLSHLTRHQLALLAKGDWSDTRWQESGLKTKEGKVTPQSAMLLLITLGVSETWSPAAKLIQSNTKDENGYFLPGGQKSRALDPKAARLRCNEFKKVYAPEKLFPKCDAYIALFKSPPSFHTLNSRKSNDEWRTDCSILFEANKAILDHWKHTKLIKAYVAGHEISCRSIRNQTFVPHTHAIVWLPRDYDPSFIEETVIEGIRVEYLPKPRKTWREIERFVQYIMQAHSIVNPYQLEFRDEDRVSFNVQAKEALRTLIELYHGTGSCYDVVAPPEPEDEEGIISSADAEGTVRFSRKKLIHKGIPRWLPRSSTRKKASNKSPARSRATKSTSKTSGRSKPKSSPKDKS